MKLPFQTYTLEASDFGSTNKQVDKRIIVGVMQYLAILFSSFFILFWNKISPILQQKRRPNRNI